MPVICGCSTRVILLSENHCQLYWCLYFQGSVRTRWACSWQREGFVSNCGIFWQNISWSEVYLYFLTKLPSSWKKTMGDWKLEVIKMGLYITFPVALFHYFNQPEYFEDWVTKTRRAIFPPDSKTHREEIQECIRNIREKKELETLRHLKEQDSGSVWCTRNGVLFSVT